VSYNAANWALSSTFVPKWQPSTAYAAGQQVISPNGDLVSAATAHTSGASFSGLVSAGGNWTVSTTFAIGRQALLETNEDYSKFTAGLPVTSLTGQPYKTRGSNNLSANLPVIESGFLTQGATANAGAYSELGPFAQSINHWGARWKFDTGTVAGAVMCLALMTKSYVDYANQTGNVPQSGPHLIITPNTLQVTVFPSDGSAPVDSGLGVITFAAGLQQDGATMYSVDLYLDNVAGIVYIYAPDGKMYAVQNNSYIGTFPYAYAEPFRNATYTAGMGRAMFKNFWVSSVSDSQIADVAADYWAQPLVKKAVTSASDVGFNLTSTYSVPAGGVTTFSALVPNSKRVHIEASFFIDITAVTGSSQVLIGLQSSGGALYAFTIVAMKVSHSGYCKFILDYGLTEPIGTTFTRKFAFAVTDTVRTDTVTVTSGSATVTDASITAADQGRPVTGTGIPAGSYVGTVTPGTSFLLSSSPTSQVNVNGTASGSSAIIGATAGASTSAALVLKPQVNGSIEVTTI
jgi:hypothetical protein